jgi:hypothetical protein
MQQFVLLLFCAAFSTDGRRAQDLLTAVSSAKNDVFIESLSTSTLSSDDWVPESDGQDTLALLLLSHRSSMRLNRRAAFAGSLALLAPAKSLADDGPFSLKGIPGISSLTGADAPRPESLGVIGRGVNKEKSGRLNQCDKKSCISTDYDEAQGANVPAWIYSPKLEELSDQQIMMGKKT